MPAPRVGPKALLSLCHQVDELSEKIRAFHCFGLRRLDGRRRGAIKRIRAALRGPHRDGFRSRLAGLRSEHGLAETDVLILVFLFNRRVRRAEHATSGREVLEALTPTGGQIIETARLLHPDAPLVRAGLVSSEASAAEDVLDGGLRISDRAFAVLYRAFHGIEAGPDDAERPAPYASAAEHLLDLRILCDVAKRRAGRIFPLSCWAEWAPDEERDAEALRARFAEVRRAIVAREAATPEWVRLPVVHLRDEYALGEEEEVILLTLLLHELFATQTTVELTELARLVATGEEDLLRRRSLVAREGRLRSSGLLCVEEEPVGKDAFASAWLPAWLAERLLGNLDPKGAIRAEEKSSFRRYLDGLRGSDDFFDRLS
jgi:hypothetical protein